MPKRLSYLDALRKFERRCERRIEKAERRAAERKAELRERKRLRQDADRLVKITHLRRKLATLARFPSRLTVTQLRAIAANPELPAEARVEAARLIQQWLFADLEELDPANASRGRTRRRN